MYNTGFDASADFHIYGFQWTQDKVKYYIDGVLKYTADYPESMHEHDYVNIWATCMSADYSGTIDETKLPGYVYYDYVRYYKPASSTVITVDNGSS